MKYSTLSGAQLREALLHGSGVCGAGQPRSDFEFSVLRLDLGTRWAMGNKYFKLRDNLDQLVVQKARRVLSFGGAWSNHLLALSQTAQISGIQSVGVVRGEEGFDNKLLARMRSHGMRLHFISRAQYRRRHDPDFCGELCQQLDCDTWLPEGGANELAVSGCEEIASLIGNRSKFTQVISAVGTGATLAGIVRGCSPTQKVTGIQVVSDPGVFDRIDHWVGNGVSASWSLFNGAGFTGAGSKSADSKSTGSKSTGSKSTAVSPYAKPSSRLLEFIVQFYKSTGIALDPVYTGPALSAALSAAFLHSIARGEKVVFVHTGGLAGAAGFISQFDQCADQASVQHYLARIHALTGQAR